MGGFTVQKLFGSLGSPGDGIVRITLLMQVKMERLTSSVNVQRGSLENVEKEYSSLFPCHLHNLIQI